MISVAIYSLSNGQIRCVLQCQDTDTAQANLRDGEAFLAITDAGERDSTHYVVDSSFVEFPVQPTPSCAWDWTSHTWQETRTLEVAKTEKWSVIKAARDDFERAGCDTSFGRVDFDDRSQTAILMASQTAAMNPTYSVEWTMQDGSNPDLSSAQLVLMGKQCMEFKTSVHARGVALKAEIMAATTIAAVDAITWSYP